MVADLLILFTPAFLGGLAANLSSQILSEAAREVRRGFQGDPEKEALERCVHAGIVGAVAVISKDEKTGGNELIKRVEAVFEEKDTAKEFAHLLSRRSVKIEELTLIASDCGLDAEQFSGFDANAVFSAFEAAFLQAAIREEALGQLIQAGNLLEQTRLQRSLVDQMAELVEFLKNAKRESVGIEAEAINAESVVNGQQITFHVNVPGPTVYLGSGLEQLYLKSLIAQCSPLDLAAIEETCSRPTQSDDAPRVTVSDIFTRLYLADVYRTSDQSVGQAIRKPGPQMNDQRMEREAETERFPISASEAVAGLERLVIMGRPGGGKSTLVNHLAVQLARRRLGGSHEIGPPEWPVGETPLPVRVVLRHFAEELLDGAKKGTAGDVWDYLGHLLKEYGCESFLPELKRILDQEGGVVFFDGLDEVRESDAEKKRSRMVQAIRAFAEPLDRCRVVVTCREYAYKTDDAWRLPESIFPPVELALFQDEQIRDFTENWYRITGPARGWDSSRCGAETEALFRAVQAQPHLRELAPYPLLLTLMAVVHGSTGLPRDRADLYERAVRLLLNHWENHIVRDARGQCTVEPSVILRLDIPVRTLRAPLERLALFAHERQETDSENRTGCADIGWSELLDELARELNGDLNRAQRVINYIQYRAGLLQEKGARVFAFPHRTFQEYLAATAIMRRGDFPAFFRERIHRNLSWWREVFLLAAGSARDMPLNIRLLVDEIVPEPGKEAMLAEVAERVGLGAQAFHETGFMDEVELEQPPGSFHRIAGWVRKWLLDAMVADQTLKSPERNEAGTALNWVGDPRFREKFHFLPDEDLLGFLPVEGGTFRMGERDDEHEVELPAFFIARFPVTVAQFRAYLEATDERPADEDSLKGPDNHPVNWVSWHEAMAYCLWLQTVLENSGAAPVETIRECLAAGWRVRLATEAEWERAARGTNGRKFPWGNEPDPNRANYNKSVIRSTSAVGCFPGGKTPTECLDMSGNVWEWTVSLVRDYPYSHDQARNNETAGNDSARVVRGGAFNLTANFVRCALRYRNLPNSRYVDVGFRVVVSPNPSL
jgi:formylglycine-generating enzyme required for sulfatase activity/energy-coupling factor transporter ATP-binding protein EcfA2